ncbi:hypothetical protein QQF64_014754 [Cirrhinus molitorella]|uniref:Uncharacterized protein n=1 Tax=Cirrhinus molitorella TaxID=172907 RepID=A0ABR3NT04_9TELE
MGSWLSWSGLCCGLRGWNQHWTAQGLGPTWELHSLEWTRELLSLERTQGLEPTPDCVQGLKPTWKQLSLQRTWVLCLSLKWDSGTSLTGVDSGTSLFGENFSRVCWSA